MRIKIIAMESWGGYIAVGGGMAVADTYSRPSCFWPVWS
jgi:hypothetical protein